MTDNTIFIARTADICRRALDAGCGWIHCDDPDAVDSLIPLCREADVIMTLQDDVDRVMATRVHGVILSPSAMAPKDAREFLGPHAVIGVEVSTADEILALAPLDLDFFVLPASKSACGNILREVREKGVEQRILSRFSDPEIIEAGADGVLTDDINAV